MKLDDSSDDALAPDSSKPAPARRRRRARPADDGARKDAAEDGVDVAEAIVRSSQPPRLVMADPLEALDDDSDGGAEREEREEQAFKRARRRPRVEHVSNPPMPAAPDGDDDSDSVAERPARPKPRAKKKKDKPARSQRPHTSNLPLEIAGVVLLAIAVLTLLSLLSYSSTDTAAGTKHVHNWIGPGGALVADVLTLVLGVAAFLVPFGLGTAAVACVRPVAQPRHAAIRTAGAFAFVVGGVVLLHLALRGSHALPFPAGGLFGALLADAASSVIAPLGTGVVALALAFVGGVIAIDRPLGPTTRSLGEWLIDQVHAARERLEVWREERRLLVEEEARLKAELVAHADDPSATEQDAAAAAAERERKKAERKQRIHTEAERRAKERLAKEQAQLAAQRDAEEQERLRAISLAPVGPSRPPAGGTELISTPSAPATVVDEGAAARASEQVASDPPWTRELDELDVDGKVISLQKVLEARQQQKQADAAGEGADDDGDGLRIVERPHKDQKEIEAIEHAKGPVAAAPAPAADEPERSFQLPPLNLLDYDAPQIEPLDEGKMRAQADKLVAKFRDFGIEGRVREVRPGPVCTTYEFVPAPGIKVSKIAALADDIAMAMEAIHVRIVAPIPGKGAVGIEIPNEKRETVYMKEIIADAAFKKTDHKLMMALGKDIEGRAYYANLAEMPHVLISGTTGSGKSVSVNAMICSILYRATPADVRFLMIDPKMLELSIYEGIPHLLLPPIIDSKKAAVALKWAVNEMERRYQLMSELGVRDVAGYNQKVLDAKEGRDADAKKRLGELRAALPQNAPPLHDPLQKMPQIVIVVDEYADLLAVAGKDVEGYVMRLAQKARAAGLHVMLATQRPSVDVITGVIKANFPVRMGFRLASSHDSKTIINRPGAEKLLGRGDMLFMPPGTSNVLRVHGAFISEKELHRVVEFLKAQGKPSYDMNILAAATEEEGAEGGVDIDEPKDARYEEAMAIVARTRKCSTSWLQRMMNLGYQRAARIVDRMEREGLVGPAQNAKGDREIFLKPEGGKLDGKPDG